MAGAVKRVPDGQDARVLVGGQGTGGRPEVLRHSARLVDDDQHVAGVDALERLLVVVGGLATESNHLFVDPPLGLVDPAGEVPLAVCFADLSPEHCAHLREGGSGSDHEGLAGRMSVEPPGSEAGGAERLTYGVTALNGRAAMPGHRLTDDPLLAPEILAQPGLHPARGVGLVAAGVT